MLLKTIHLFALTLVVLLLAGPAGGQTLTPMERLGEFIFEDTDLSINKNQSCAACHTEEWGWSGPDSTINAHGAVYEGSIPDRFGNRRPPTSAYATESPIFHLSSKSGGSFIGGNFWDGRATGERLGNPAADQALGPFLNPVEQALPDEACVVYRVSISMYNALFTDIWGDEIVTIVWPPDVETVCSVEGGRVTLSDDDRAKVIRAYENIGLSVAAYEASPKVNAFTSKFDRYLAKQVDLTKEEKKGLSLFNGKGKCTHCHKNNGDRPLFTDFTFHNLGVPRNPENPFYTMPVEFNPLGAAWIDLGLGGFLNAQMSHPEWLPFARENFGKHKVPTVRNADKRPNPSDVKAFGHNGYFKSLKEIVHFYNTRDVLRTCGPNDPGEKTTCWPLPELALNMNTGDLGDLGLSDEDEDAIVAFLKTLSDGFQP